MTSGDCNMMTSVIFKYDDLGPMINVMTLVINQMLTSVDCWVDFGPFDGDFSANEMVTSITCHGDLDANEMVTLVPFDVDDDLSPIDDLIDDLGHIVHWWPQSWPCCFEWWNADLRSFDVDDFGPI